VTCCNCGPCRKAKGLEPTGQLILEARKEGFDNVHDYLASGTSSTSSSFPSFYTASHRFFNVTYVTVKVNNVHACFPPLMSQRKVLQA
jgi:hypothetical protein